MSTKLGIPSTPVPNELARMTDEGVALANKILGQSEKCAGTMAADPIVEALRSGKLSEDQQFRLVATIWCIKQTCYLVLCSWGKTNVWGLRGEYQEVDHFTAKQLWDESRLEHRLVRYALKRKWIASEEELYGHPYAVSKDGVVRLIFWLRGLAKFQVPVRYAGYQLSSQVVERGWFHALADAADPELAKVLRDHPSHIYVNMGRVVLGKYADDPAMIKECIWAANCALDLYLNMLHDLAVSMEVLPPDPEPPRG